MLKQVFLYFLLTLVIISNVSCSSNQDAIEQAVQQTVEAQQESTQPIDRQTANQTDQNEKNVEAQQEDTQQVDQEAADLTDQNDITIGEDSSTSAAEENQPSSADSILGIWSGTPGLVVGEDEYQHTYDAITFFNDVVIFHGEEGDAVPLIYDSIDADTLVLSDIVGPSIGTLQISQESPDSLNLTLIYNHEPDNIYESSELKKTADVEIADVPSIEEAILGSWSGSSVDVGNLRLFDFVAGHWLSFGSDSTIGQYINHLQRYEFQEANRFIAYEPYYPESLVLWEAKMPNENTLLLWEIEEDEDIGPWIDRRFALNRESKPSPVIQRPQNEVLYPFHVDEAECGYIDRNGNIAIEPTFAWCGAFHEGLAVVAPFRVGEDEREYNLWGYIDNSGQFVINPQFDEAGNFNEGVAWARKRETSNDENQYIGYINPTGEYVIPAQYDSGESFSDGLAYVNILEPAWSGYIDKTGTVIFESDPDSYGGDFGDGLLATDHGYLDKTGELAIEVENGQSGFSEGLASIGPGDDDDGCYYINKEGTVVIQTGFSSCRGFSEGLAAVYNNDVNQCGYIDTDGDLVIELRFDGCGIFSEDRAYVRVGDYSGYIDRQGDYIFDLYDFDYADDFHEALALVITSDRWGYIDRDGNFVLEP